MSDKTELYATHPKTGKRHRWEIGDKRSASAGEFILVAVSGGCAVVGQWLLTSVSEEWFFILRDLGPVEDEKKGLPIIGDDNSRHQLEVNWKAACAKADRFEAELAHTEEALRDTTISLKATSSNCVAWRNKSRELEARVEELEAAVHSEHDKVISYRSACARYKSLLSTAEHSEKELRERLAASPAPLPVGVVRLPISESADDDGNFSEFGTFRLDVLEFPQSGDVVLVPAYMRGASFQAVTVPRALPTGDRDNLRIILRRLDAPDGETTDKPTPCPYCEGKGTDPLDGRWDCRECEGEGYLKPAPSQPVPNAGPITTEAWILRTANEEKPAPPKDALGTACPRCHGTGWDVPPGTVTPGKEQSPGYKCPDCLGSGIAAPPKEEPKRTALVIFRNGQAVWSSDGYPLGPSMTLHHC
jgi:hypothetical protein